MAGWLSDLLESGGFSVNTVSNSPEKIDNCRVVFGKGNDKTITGQTLIKIFGKCDKKTDEQLSEDEVELYFGDKYAQMVNYQSYNSL